ncbi:MAG: hypothetical protein LBP92_06895 [Deltaproteobacteria bacterium]|jgi:hypothetical protein|nr:hypothetical protein [Deltaproteobacteria bacterium]
MVKFAVIDTETTWGDAVMSIGIVIAEADNFEPIEQRYYILTPFKNHGGMYTHALYAGGIRPDLECSREQAVRDLSALLSGHGVTAIFAYNAAFDKRHMPELSHLAWYDIMKLAAYRQHNPKIPGNAECHGTGRLKSGYGVESVYRMLSEEDAYCELHNALTDALDELTIMKLLNHELGRYARI